MMIETQMATPSPVSWPHRAAEPPAVHQAHVLAVDDSHVDRKVIETLLRVSSCKVTAVDSGRRALQFLGLDDERSGEGGDEGVMGLKVDMIVTDYSMPGMTGYELLKRIKGSTAFREVPVVIMSSEDINARIDRCLEEGAEDYIVKPVKLADVKRIKDYMTRDERRSEVAAKESRIHKRKSREETDRTMMSMYPELSTSSLPESASPEIKSQQLSNTSNVENQSSSPLTTQLPHSLSQSCFVDSESSVLHQAATTSDPITAVVSS